MTSYLDLILEWTREHRLPRLQKSSTAGDLARRAVEAPAVRPFRRPLASPGISLIAEFKRRSPSAGELNPQADPEAQAKAYESGGASAMSVLTEPEFFGGGFEDLLTARQSCSLPVLRKDFLLVPVQVVEARAYSADAVLLIAAAIKDRILLKEMCAAAEEMGMDALIEVHEEKELDLAFEVEPLLIGVNQRDLTTFKIDHDLAIRVRKEIPDNVTVVAESGVSSPEQIQQMRKSGIDAVLVGETLMKTEDPAQAIKELLAEGE
ncbi:MAG TPA: indole-3-glycerol phosphate synthase TrpC [Actinomycetota bacterium]|nr:indole-3-glycerol phosphate synthase TrpC [Actinomycetota bacterium]